MRQDGLPDSVALPLRTTTNNQIALQQMCEQGMGSARLLYVDVRSALELGALVRVLPKQGLPRQPLTLMRPNRDRDPAKVRVALTALTRYFETLPSPS
jgi:DNA-binding transcriptional LysR family regulator